MNKSVLTPAHAAFLADTVARNRALYGGWSMEDEGDAAAKAAADAAAAAKAAADKAAADAAGGGSKNATDSDGKDLGYPKDTPVAEMSDAQQAAYHRYHSRKHETRYKSLVGDRTPEQVKADLEEIAKIRREQQTPSEKAINDARDEARKEAIASERKTTATTLFRGALESSNLKPSEIDELVADAFNAERFISDDGVDTTKIANFAKRFTQSGTDTTRTRQRDFGGGSRGGSGGDTERGAGGKAEAQRRFGTK